MAEKTHLLIPTILWQSKSFQEDLAALLSLTAEQIDTLAGFADSEAGFELSDQLLDSAAENLKVDHAKLLQIVTVADFLYDHARIAGVDDVEAVKQLGRYAKRLNIMDFEQKATALRQLFTKKESYDRRMLVDASASAAIPTITNITTACDIRAVVEPKSGHILGYLPVTVIGVELEEGERRTRSITFQLDEKSVSELADTIDKARKLLSDIKRQLASKIPIMEPPRKED